MIIKDTREQKGWEFEEFTMGALKTGDYTYEGLENILCVERKGTFSELALNLTQERFWRELERMSQFKHPYIICEFELKDIMLYPYNMGTLQKKIKVRGPYLLKKIAEAELMGIHFIFAGKYGKEFFLSLVKRLNGG